MIIFWLAACLMLIAALGFIFYPVIIAHPKGFFYKTPIILKSLILVLPLLVLVLYFQVGNSSQLNVWYKSQQQAALANKLRSELGSSEKVIEGLKHMLAMHPDSAKGWYLLGRVYVTQQKFNEASSAFANAYRLAPDNATVLFQYAQALFFVTHSLSGEPTKLLQKVIRLEPNNYSAMNLLAVAKFQQGNYQEAVDYWEKILAHVASNDPNSQALLKAIANAQNALAKQHGIKR